MAQSTTILNQLLNLVPETLFDNLAKRYKVDYKATVFFAKTHFAVMMFVQLAGLKSIRDVVNATISLFSWHHQRGLVSVKKSSLGDANQRIDYRFYRDLFLGLLAEVRAELPKHEFPLPGKLFTLDSTQIKLCLSQFPWAVYRRLTGAIKLHTLLDNDGIIPEYIIMTNGKVHDIRPARKLKIIENATYLMDRAYVDSKWLNKIHKQGAFFVTRWKINIGFLWSKSFETSNKEGVIGEWIGHLDGTSGINFPDELRVVKYIDPDTKKELWFLTNLMDIDAQTVADLYKHRWQIELFFKWIKQNLKIKKFLGKSENAVMTQIWVAMIAYLLIQVQKAKLKTEKTAHQLLVYIRTNLIAKVPKNLIWQGFKQRTKQTDSTDKQTIRSLLTMNGH